MFSIEKIIDAPTGQDIFIRQDNNSNIIVYILDKGKVRSYSSPFDNGQWNELSLVQQDFTLNESGFIQMRGTYTGEIDIVYLTNRDDTRAFIWPNDGEEFVYDDPYRLYWATDTRKLYMNIANVWSMIGTLNHKLLDNVGTLTHEQIDEKLAYLDNKINSSASLTDFESTINSMSNNYENLREEVNSLKSAVDELGNHSGGSGGSGGSSNILIEESNVQIESGYTGKCFATKIGNLLTIDFEIDGDITDLSTLFTYSNLEGYFPITLLTGYDLSDSDMYQATLVCIMGSCFIRTPPGIPSTGYIRAYGNFTISLASKQYQT